MSKRTVNLKIEKSSPVSQAGYVQLGICGTHIAIGKVHEDFVDDIIDAVNSASASTEIDTKHIIKA